MADKDPTSPLTNEELISIWAKAVDTQMHFNEMSVKSRQLGLTFVAAALGVAIVMMGQGRDFSLTIALGDWGVEVHVAVLLVLAALLAVLAVRRLDLDVYHRMLRGAVTFGEDLERTRLSGLLGLEKGMTQAISHYSRHSDAGVDVSASSYRYTGKNRKSAETKIRSFYRLVIWFLVIGAAVLLAVTNLQTSAHTNAAPVLATEAGSASEAGPSTDARQ